MSCQLIYSLQSHLFKYQPSAAHKLCVCSGGGVGPCFVVFAEEFRGAGPKQNSSLLE